MTSWSTYYYGPIILKSLVQLIEISVKMITAEHLVLDFQPVRHSKNSPLALPAMLLLPVFCSSWTGMHILSGFEEALHLRLYTHMYVYL